jgi:hypothetical protein
LPIRYEIDPSARHLEVVLEGRVTPDEYLAHVAELAAASLLGYSRLVDARDADFPITTADVDRTMALFAHMRAEHGHARTAFVVSNPALYGMLRMYQIRNEGADPGFGVFRAMEEARAWISGHG